MVRLSVLMLAVISSVLAISATAGEPAKKANSDEGWISLFDGKSLKGWKVTDFGGQGEPSVADGQILLPFGSDMTGITWTGKIVKDNYEVELDAKRVDGNDFFCGLTFPVRDSHCSFICGGWGGGVIGLSSINGMDASENSTSDFHEFKSGQWYHIRVRVAGGRIQTWIDREKAVDFEMLDNRFSTRLEVELSKPLGIATWCTTGAVKNIRMRPVKAGS